MPENRNGSSIPEVAKLPQELIEYFQAALLPAIGTEIIIGRSKDAICEKFNTIKGELPDILMKELQECKMLDSNNNLNEHGITILRQLTL